MLALGAETAVQAVIGSTVWGFRRLKKLRSREMSARGYELHSVCPQTFLSFPPHNTSQEALWSRMNYNSNLWITHIQKSFLFFWNVSELTCWFRHNDFLLGFAVLQIKYVFVSVVITASLELEVQPTIVIGIPRRAHTSRVSIAILGTL